MSSPDRRPSADELDRLIEQVRRDPGSSAFVALGDAYLTLGRPRDAVEVGTAGLRAIAADEPSASDGRVMVARALAAMHQWKEAQAELLRVVKVDRNHRAGFALLGEVLLRRGDYERALPVLQHAQNLEPSNPAVLAMLRKARGNQPLDPPPPIPTPIEPVRAKRPSAAPPPPGARRPPPPREATLDDGPTNIGGPSLLRGDPTDVSLDRDHHEVTGEITGEPTAMAPSLGRGGRPEPAAAPPPDTLRRGARPSAPPPMGQMAAQAAAAKVAPRRPEPAAPETPAAVRPRVIGGAKQHNPAAEALRTSAAAGENYLNDLLTGGLLEVPGVRVPDSEFDIKPDRRWGRSAGRTFFVMFVVLILGSAGAVTWWFYNEKAKNAAIREYRAAAAELVVTGSFRDLEEAGRTLAKALDKDGDDALTFAQVAQVTALQALLYGLPPGAAKDSIEGAARDITKPEQAGYRELVVARGALALATLADATDANASLAAARSALETFLADHPDDRWVRWLQARAMLAAGERQAARSAFQTAADGDDGVIPAIIDLADLLVDDGKLSDAETLYARALDRAKDHPLALVGEIVAWAERGVEEDKALGILNVSLPEKKNFGPRVRAYRQLALGLAQYQIQEFEASDAALVQALTDGPKEPRYLGRVALARLLAGDFASAVKARGSIAWFGKGKPENDPVVALFDAALLVESGLPERALDVLGTLDSTRAHIIRASALLDLGGQALYDRGELDQDRLAKASAEAQAAAASAPKNAEASALVAWTKFVTLAAKLRDDAAKIPLNDVANKIRSKRGRHTEGAALLMVGDPDARGRLEQALEEISPNSPHPFPYRTHTLLARLDLADKKLDDGMKHADAALAANGNYLPAMVVKAKILLEAGDADGGLAAITPVLGAKVDVDASDGGKPGDADRLVAQVRPQLRACYGGLLRSDPSAGGKVKITVAVGADGKVADGSAKVEPDAGLLGLEECVAAAFAGPFEAGPPIKVTVTLSIEPDDVSAEVELVRAVGLAARKEATPEDRKEAAACIERARKKNAPAAELARVGALVSADVLDGAPPAEAPPPKPAPKKKRRR